MGNLRYKGYTGSVEYSEEYNCLFGKVLGLRKDAISYEGYSIKSLKKDFQDAIDFYLQSCKERGVAPAKPYSGKLVLRMPSDLHSRIAIAASMAGTTINDYINRALVREVENSVAF